MTFLCTSSWTPEAIIALCALFVSITSVVFTWLTLKYQRQHNYKTVKPIGVIVAGDYENKIFIRIDNNGTGPLIIEKVTVTNRTLTANTVIDIIPNDISNRIQWTDFAASLEKKAIPVGQKLDLLVWTINDTYQQLGENRIVQDRTDLRNVLKDITVTLDYTDVYEKTKFQTVRTMEWFGRHTKK